MNRPYKYVSGVGKVLMSEAEINETQLFELEEKSEIDINELSKRVDKVLEMLKSIKLLSSAFDGAGDKNGDS